MHDTDHPLKAHAGELLAGAQALAAAGNNRGPAREALARVKAARTATEPAAPPAVKWERVASLAALMKQVPLVHSGLKRGIEPSRLARQATQSAGQSATLAAIAQASLFDTEYTKSPADAEKWTQFCAQMRDASGEINAAIHAQDQPRVAAGMKRLAESCDACHARFRALTIHLISQVDSPTTSGKSNTTT